MFKIKDSKFNYKKIFKALAVCFMGVISVLYLIHEIREHFHYECESKYSFVNPVFACYKKITINKKAYLDLKVRLMEFISQEKKEGRTTDIGIFFRDLEAGPTLGINDRVDFIPASLLKLPHALALMRFAEEESPNILLQKLEYVGEINFKNKQEFSSENFMKPNVVYTAIEVMERSLIYSDNLASDLIFNYLNKLSQESNLIKDVYRDLGILNDYDFNASLVGVKAYSSMFRLLYNSSFLNSDSSEKLLEILSRSSFQHGLRSGVPQNIKIAHKFGEREIPNTGEKQLHDCGIIYYPTNPYLLCIMTRGKDFKELSKIIEYISEEVYKEFDSRRLKN